MRDLEIRGAGDLLGLKQSGYIASVGFHLYSQLLAQAVQKLKAGQPLVPESMLRAPLPANTGPTITIDLPVPAFVPTDYIPEMSMRLQLYRRIGDLHTVEAVDEMEAELLDRFGSLPPEVSGLLYQVKVKLLAQLAGATAVVSGDNQVSVRLSYLAGIDRAALQRYLGNDVRVSRTAVWLPRDLEESDWQARLINVLQKLQRSAMELSVQAE
jgi:transcription-repair coupling factor (superfamily II helicase)